MSNLHNANRLSNLQKMNEIDKAYNNFYILSSSGLIAISLISLQVYISTGVSDTPIFISLKVFSTSLPLLVASIILFRNQIDTGYYDSKYSKILRGRRYSTSLFSTMFAWVCAFIGIDAALWHITWIAATIFIIVAILSFIIYVYEEPNSDEILRLRREEADDVMH
jgi:hypothetical protein